MTIEQTNYVIALQNLAATAAMNRSAFQAKVNAWTAQAKAAGVSDAAIIQQVMVPFGAWNNQMATLADQTIPSEIIRIQNGGAVGSLSNFQLPNPPALPSINAVAYVPPTQAPLPTSPYTPINTTWGSPGKEVPQGSTINYGNLNQLYQQAQAAGDVATANQIAAQINAITAAGPVANGFVPITGVDADGNAVTPGAGVVHTPTGVVVVPGLTTPGIGGALPPAPTGVSAINPVSINVRTALAPVAASAQGSGGGSGTTNTSGGASTLGAVDPSKSKGLPPLAVVGGVAIPGWLPLVIVAAVVLYALND